MAATALVVLNENLPAPDVTDAELRSCSAETLEAGWTVYPTYTCFAHNKTYSEIRLRIPTRTYSTALGQLAGINTIDHSAFAQAGAAPNRIEILPFALEADAGLYECVKTGTATPDCTGGNSGNFGDLDFFFVGNPDKGTVHAEHVINVGGLWAHLQAGKLPPPLNIVLPAHQITRLYLFCCQRYNRGH